MGGIFLFLSLFCYSLKAQVIYPDLESLMENANAPSLPGYSMGSDLSDREEDSSSLDEAALAMQLNPLLAKQLMSNRDTRRVRITVCRVSRSRLSEIRQSIILARLPMVCNLNVNDGAQGCENFLRYIQCCLLIMRRGMRTATNTTNPARTTEMLENALSTMATEMERNMSPMLEELGVGAQSTIDNAQQSVRNLQMEMPSMVSAQVQTTAGADTGAYVSARAEIIRTGDETAIIDCAKNDWNEIRPSQTSLITEAYQGNQKNGGRVLLFISNLPKKEDQAYAYPKLFEEMVRANQFDGHEILTLAYRADALSKMYLNVPWAVAENLKKIRNALPPAISALLFNDQIKMVPNTNINHYLGMVSGYGNQGRGLEDPSIIACPVSTTNLHYKWNVDKLANGRYFRFRNTEFGKSFGSVSSKCMTVNKGTLSQHEWEVIPTRNGTLFWFKNRSNGRYMEAGPNPYYAVPFSLKRQTCEFPWGTYRWKSNNEDSNKQLWRIQ